MSEPHDLYYSVTALRERSWTTTAIDRFLPEPDKLARNSHNSQIPCKLWLKERVHQIEETAPFKAWKTKLGARAQLAKRGVSSRVESMIAVMGKVEIEIDSDWRTDQIRKAAQAEYLTRQIDRGYTTEFFWSKRAARNFIRRRLTNYEALWSLCNRGETGGPAYAILRSRVDALINEVYPQFAET
jgi:hypothetical protein